MMTPAARSGAVAVRRLIFSLLCLALQLPLSIPAHALDESGIGLHDIPHINSGVNLYTGDAELRLPLATIKGRNGLGYTVSARYSSNVMAEVSTSNAAAPTGAMGLGWSLDFPRILGAGKNSAGADSTYYLVQDGSKSRLLPTGTVRHGNLVYLAQEHTAWAIEFDPSMQRWTVIDENGMRMIFGDRVLDTTQKTMQWGAGASIYNLAEMVEPWGDKLSFAYTRVESPDSGAGQALTRESYLAEVRNNASFGDRIVLTYAAKVADARNQEYAPAQAIGADAGSTAQERYQTRYLDHIEVFTRQSPRAGSRTNLGYAFLDADQGMYAKRVLTSVLTLNADARAAAPATQYAYYGKSANPQENWGALKTITGAAGGVTAYTYSTITPQQAARERQVVRPPGYTKLRSWNGADYVVLLWAAPGPAGDTVRLQTFSWDGRWVPGQVTVMPQVPDWRGVQVTTGPDFFELERSAASPACPAGCALLTRFNKDQKRSGMWLAADDISAASATGMTDAQSQSDSQALPANERDPGAGDRPPHNGAAVLVNGAKQDMTADGFWRTASSDAARGDQTFGADQTVIAYLGENADAAFEDALLLTLMRPQPVYPYKFAGAAPVKVVSAVERRTGYETVPNAGLPALITRFIYDSARATADSAGRHAHFNQVSVRNAYAASAPGERHYGFTEVYFLNGLNPLDWDGKQVNSVLPNFSTDPAVNIGNSQDYYRLLQGVPYFSRQCNEKVSGSNDCSSALQSATTARYFQVSSRAVSGNDQAWTIAPVRQVSSIDGLTSSTTQTWFDAGAGPLEGFLKSTEVTQKNARHESETERTELIYAMQAYPDWNQDAHLLTPLAQVRRQRIAPGAATPATLVSTATTYKDWGNGHWGPLASYAWQAQASSDSFNFASPNPDWRRGEERDLLTSTGLVEQSRLSPNTAATSMVSAVKYGSDQRYALATFRDARLKGSKANASYWGMEAWENDNEDSYDTSRSDSGRKWSLSNASFTLQDSHTGKRALISTAGGMLLSRRFTPPAAPAGEAQDYVLSAYVKMGFGAGQQVMLAILAQNSGGQPKIGQTVYAPANPGAALRWQYVEVYLHAQDIISLTPQISVAGAGVLIDDLRFGPAESTFSATVVDSASGNVTARLGHNGEVARVLFDTFGQPYATIDTLGNVSGTSLNYFSRSGNGDRFAPADPNNTISFVPTVEGTYADFRDGSSDRWACHAPACGVENQQLKLHGVGSTQYLDSPTENYAVRFKVRKLGGAPDSIRDFSASVAGRIRMSYREAEKQLQLAENCAFHSEECWSGVMQVGAPGDGSLPQDWLISMVDDSILVFADGQKVFDRHYAGPATPLADTTGQLSFSVNNDAATDIALADVLILNQPMIYGVFSDGAGRSIQNIALDGDKAAVKGVLYDANGVPDVQSKTVRYPLAGRPSKSGLFQYRPDFLTRSSQGVGGDVVFAYGAQAHTELGYTNDGGLLSAASSDRQAPEPQPQLRPADCGAAQVVCNEQGEVRFWMDAKGAAQTPNHINYRKTDRFGRVTEEGTLVRDFVRAQLEAEARNPALPATPATWRKQWKWGVQSGTVSENSYAKGRLSSVLTNNGSAQPDARRYVYDRQGRVVAALESVAPQAGEMLTRYTYNFSGAVSGITEPAPAEPAAGDSAPLTVLYSYDRAGRLSRIGRHLNDVTVDDYYARYDQYGPNDELLSETLNNSAAPDARVTTEFSYHAPGRLKSISGKIGNVVAYSQNLRYADGSTPNETAARSGDSSSDITAISQVYNLNGDHPQTLDLVFSYFKAGQLKSVQASGSLAHAADYSYVARPDSNPLRSRRAGGQWPSALLLSGDGPECIAQSSVENGAQATCFCGQGSAPSLILRNGAPFDEAAVQSRKYMIYGPTGLIAVNDDQNGDGPTDYYLVKDYQRSTILVVKQDGTLNDGYSYTPDGKVFDHSGAPVRSEQMVPNLFQGRAYDWQAGVAASAAQ